ncbi:MAG: cohesin domain-containing protein [Dehalococcoidia bacterium]
MNRTVRHLARTAGALAVAIAALALLASIASAQELGAGDASGEIGGEVTVEVTASDIGDPGLGAWSIDIVYDNAIVSAVSCDASVASGATNVCNEEFDDDTVRVAGAAGVGIEGDTTLVEITFSCDAEGTSPLEIAIEHFADGTIGGPVEIDATVSHGSVTCAEGDAGGLPDAGEGGRSDRGLLFVGMGLLAAVGLAAIGRGFLGSRNG